MVYYIFFGGEEDVIDETEVAGRFKSLKQALTSARALVNTMDAFFCSASWSIVPTTGLLSSSTMSDKEPHKLNTFPMLLALESSWNPGGLQYIRLYGCILWYGGQKIAPKVRFLCVIMWKNRNLRSLIEGGVKKSGWTKPWDPRFYNHPPTNSQIFSRGVSFEAELGVPCILRSTFPRK